MALCAFCLQRTWPQPPQQLMGLHVLLSCLHVFLMLAVKVIMCSVGQCTHALMSTSTALALDC